MNATIRGMIALAGLAATVGAPAVADGFEHTMTCSQSGRFACKDGESPRPVHWNARCVRYQLNDHDSPHFTGNSKELSDIQELRRAVADSFAAWTQVQCSDMTLVDGGLTSQSRAIYDSDGGRRNTNLVILHDDGWSGVASARAFALTSVTFNSDNGDIVDADIEVNSEFYDFSSSEKPRPDHVDLRNTLTHEVGHFLGLDHSKIHEATMFSTAPIGQTSKRSLHPDDIKGLCTIYPSGQGEASACDSASDFPSPNLDDSDGLCTITSTNGAAPPSFALAFIALVGAYVCMRRWLPSAEPL